MMEAVKEGTGREDAHAAIKEHALATVYLILPSAENSWIDRE